jgi:AraC-like DNA-binding protein
MAKIFEKGFDGRSRNLLRASGQMVAQVAGMRPRFREWPESSFLVLVYSSMKPARPKPLSDRRLRKVEEYVESNLANAGVRLTLEALAKVAKVSPFHFHRMFTKWKGMTPHEFVTHTRVERAKRLLREHPEKSVVKIAAEVGCADESHLCRLFQNKLGMTPNRFRASAK